MNINAAMIADALDGKRSSQGWRAPCPVIDHRSNKHNPLSIIDGVDGKPIVYCHAGCSFQDIADELKSRGLWPETSRKQANEYRQKRKSHIAKSQLEYARIFVAIIKADADAGRVISPDSKVILKKCCRLLQGATHAH